MIPAAKYITSLPIAIRMRSTTFTAMVKWHLFVFFVIICCAACSPTKQNTGKPAVKQEAKVVLPQQPVATPADVNFVYDYEEVFTPGQEKSLDSLVRNFEKSNLISVKITTVNDPGITAENFDQSNKALLDEWSALHGKSDRCMVISISKSLRRIRVDYGPFVSRLLSDDEAKAIIENHFKPSFRQEQYFQGTLNGVNAIMDTIRKNIKF